MRADDFQSWRENVAPPTGLRSAISPSLYEALPRSGDWALWNRWLSDASRKLPSIEREAHKEILRAVEAAVRSHPELRDKITVYAKGSVANETNVRGVSDLDVAVEWERERLRGKPGDLVDRRHIREANTPRSPSPESLRTWVVEALKRDPLLYRNLFLAGDKSIKVEPSTPATDTVARSLYVDVVPCYALDWQSDERPVKSGIRLFSVSGRIIDNWPEQHANNGCRKQAATRGRYKKVVRALKAIRCHLVLTGELDPDRLKGFTVESLVWNAPIDLFAHVDLYDDIGAVVTYLHRETAEPWRCGNWTEADGLGKLFRPGKRELDESHRFLSAVIEATGIDRLSDTWNYAGAIAESAAAKVA